MLDFEAIDKNFERNMFGTTEVLELPTGEMDRDEWVKVRRSIPGVGGSDVGALMGVSPYMSPARLFYEKIGFLPSSFKDNRFAFWGRILEERVFYAWQYWHKTESIFLSNEANGKKTREGRDRPAIIYNKDFPAQYANIDGEITKHPRRDGHGVLEIKLMGRSVESKWMYGIPAHYLCQLMSYMSITGSSYGEFAFVIRDDFLMKLHLIDSDIELIEMMRDRCNELMESVFIGCEIMNSVSGPAERYELLKEHEPVCDHTADYVKLLGDLRKKFEPGKVFKLGEGGDVDAQYNLSSLAAQYKAGKQAKKDIEEKILRTEGAIKSAMLREDIKKIQFEGSSISFNKRISIS